MKKFLGMLSALVISTTSISSVVSCATNIVNKNDESQENILTDKQNYLVNDYKNYQTKLTKLDIEINNINEQDKNYKELLDNLKQQKLSLQKELNNIYQQLQNAINELAKLKKETGSLNYNPVSVYDGMNVIKISNISNANNVNFNNGNWIILKDGTTQRDFSIKTKIVDNNGKELSDSTGEVNLELLLDMPIFGLTINNNRVDLFGSYELNFYSNDTDSEIIKTSFYVDRIAKSNTGTIRQSSDFVYLSSLTSNMFKGINFPDYGYAVRENNGDIFNLILNPKVSLTTSNYITLTLDYNKGFNSVTFRKYQFDKIVKNNPGTYYFVWDGYYWQF